MNLPQGANADHDGAAFVGLLTQGRDDVTLDLPRDDRIDCVPGFWMRLAGAGPDGPGPLRPPEDDRYVAMKETIAAIGPRQTEQSPLVP